MTESQNDVPIDPMDDPSLSPDPPAEPEAKKAAEQMNDPDGAQPGVSDDAPEPGDDDPLPPTAGEPG